MTLNEWLDCLERLDGHGMVISDYDMLTQRVADQMPIDYDDEED